MVWLDLACGLMSGRIGVERALVRGLAWALIMWDSRGGSWDI